MEKSHVWTSLLLLCALQFVLVNCNYIFKLNLISFINPTDRVVGGACCVCCEMAGVCINQCDMTSRICLRPAGFSALDPACPLATLQGSPQPRGINLGVAGPWPGSVQLYIRASHRNGTEDTGPELIDDPLLDTFFIEIVNIDAHSPGTNISTFTGMFSQIQAEMQFAVACELPFYGSDCSVMCIDRNDSAGHYRCDQNGQRQCLEGYQNRNSDCIECIPADGCSSVGGYCNSPGTCMCRDGWLGDLCDLCIPSEGCSAVGGYCDLPGQCRCKSGYSGDNCTKAESRGSLTPSPSASTLQPHFSRPPTAPLSPREDNSFRPLPGVIVAGLGGFLLLLILIIGVIAIAVVLFNFVRRSRRKNRGFLERMYTYTPDVMGRERNAFNNENDHNLVLVSHTPNTTLPDVTCSTFQSTHSRNGHTQASITDGSDQSLWSFDSTTGESIVTNTSSLGRGERMEQEHSPPRYDHLLPINTRERNIYWASPGSSGRSMQRTEAQLTADTGHDGSGEENMNFDLEEYLKAGSGDVLSYSTEVQTSYSNYGTD